MNKNWKKDRTVIRMLRNARQAKFHGRKINLCELMERNFIAKHIYDEKLSDRAKRLLEILSR